MAAMGPGQTPSATCDSWDAHPVVNILGQSASHDLLLDFPLPPLLLLPFPSQWCQGLWKEKSIQSWYLGAIRVMSGYITIGVVTCLYPNRFVLTPRLVRNVNEPQLHPRRDSFLWTHGCIQPYSLRRSEDTGECVYIIYIICDSIIYNLWIFVICIYIYTRIPYMYITIYIIYI